MASSHSTSGKLIPAVSYIRMSSGKQEASPDQQRAEVKKLAERHGCKILREYFDSAISGDATDRRKGFLEMHRAACNGRDFEVILCWDQDRFGRFDSIEAGYWIKPLRDAGVRLITVLDRQIDQGAERILSAPASIASTLYAKLEKLQDQRRQLQADPVTSPAECPQENPLANQRAVPFHGETSKRSIYMQRLRESTPTGGQKQHPRPALSTL